jgi:hypothetical protein
MKPNPDKPEPNRLSTRVFLLVVQESARLGHNVEWIACNVGMGVTARCGRALTVWVEEEK